MLYHDIPKEHAPRLMTLTCIYFAGVGKDFGNVVGRRY
jgi:hypothetical protein